MSIKELFGTHIWVSSFLPVRVLRLLVAVVRDIREGYLSLRATSLVYTTMLALVPVLAICFSVLKGIGAHSQIEPLLKNLLLPLGEQGDEIATYLVGFVDKIQVGVLGVVGFSFLIYAVIALMHKIEIAFNDIWRVPNARRFAVRVRDYLGVLLILPPALFLSFGMATSLKHAEFLKSWLGVDLLNTAFEQVFLILPYILFVVAFTVLYIVVPNTRVRFIPAFIASVVTGVLLKILASVFGLFVEGSGNYEAIYSAFAGLIFFIMLLYFGWMVILTGASICYYLQNPSNQSMTRRGRVISSRLREKLALQICADVGRVFYAHQKPLAPQDISRKMLLPLMVVEGVVDDLIAAQILAHTDDGLIPAIAFDETTVYDMMQDLRTASEGGILDANRVEVSKAVEKVLKLSDKVLQDSWGNMTLKELSITKESEQK